MGRSYEQAAKLITACFTDTSFTPEEAWIMKRIKKTADSDQHPDAIACRLRLALVCYECGEEVPWEVEPDMGAYTQKYANVSLACRLTLDEEELFLRHVKDPARSDFLKAVKEAGSRKEGEDSVEINFEGAPSEIGGLKMTSLLQAIGVNFAGQMAGNPAIMANLNWRYERPSRPLRGGGAVSLLRELEHDELTGRKQGCGILLLYDMLLGRVDLSITGQAAVGGIVEPLQRPLSDAGLVESESSLMIQALSPLLLPYMDV